MDMEITGGQVGDIEAQVVIDINAMRKTVPPFPSHPCIPRVLYRIRHANNNAYTPEIISIGPYHHGEPKLQEMEVNKQRYLNDFLERAPNVKLEEYVKILRDLEQRARGFYAELNTNITSKDFIKIMLLDGCFIVELFLRMEYFELRKENDLLFKAVSTLNALRRDMFLIENQLPFFVLEHLFNKNVQGRFVNTNVQRRFENVSFGQITLHFFHHWVGGDPFKGSWDQVNHFVDLLHQHIFTREISKDYINFRIIPSATQLHEAGVKFQKGSISREKLCDLDVKFANGVFEIPPLQIEDDTESLFRNLIAMEQCDDGKYGKYGKAQYLSQYVYLMDCLIDSPNDVALLRKYKIIDSWMGHDEEISQLFNKLGTGISIRDGFYYGRLCKDVNGYYNIYLTACMAGKTEKGLFQHSMGDNIFLGCSTTSKFGYLSFR